MLLVGVPGAFTVAGLMTTFQTVTSDEYRGRVYGALNAVEGGAVIVGIAIASWLGELVGIVPIIAIQGGGYVVGGLVVLLALRHSPAADVHPERSAEAEADPGLRPGELVAGVGEDAPSTQGA
jgi:MFS family permease